MLDINPKKFITKALRRLDLNVSYETIEDLSQDLMMVLIKSGATSYGYAKVAARGIVIDRIFRKKEIETVPLNKDTQKRIIVPEDVTDLLVALDHLEEKYKGLLQSVYGVDKERMTVDDIAKEQGVTRWIIHNRVKRGHLIIKRAMIKKYCLVCGGEFTGKASKKYCSQFCRNQRAYRLRCDK